MPHGTIEHVNLTVSDIERSAALFADLLGWQERWRGSAQHGGEVLHLGEAGNGGATYLALYMPPTGSQLASGEKHEKGRPLNHVGFEVDDLAAAEEVVKAHGLAPWGHDDYEPGERFYFYDWDGIEFEVVSYPGS